MNLSWQNPGWLWGLFTLAVPILIHLLNHTAGRPVVFAAVRFVPPAPSAQLVGIALSQRLLLAVRCLLLAALCVLLAQPILERDNLPAGRVAVLVSPLALAWQPEAAAALGRSLADESGATPRVLARGYPQLGEVPAPRQPAEATLQDLDSQLAKYEQVVVVAAAGGADRLWKRPVLAAQIQWHELEPGPTSRPTTGVAVLAATSRQEDARYLAAALTAVIDRGEPDRLELLPVAEAARADILFALGPVEVGSTPADRPRLLLITDSANDLAPDQLLVGDAEFAIALQSPAREGLPLLTSLSGAPVATLDAAQLHWHSRFHPDATDLVLAPQFPLLLQRWLQMATVGPPQWQPQQPAFAWWTAVLVLLLWALERWLSLKGPRHAS